jgi:hypothetical protein
MDKSVLWIHWLSAEEDRLSTRSFDNGVRVGADSGKEPEARSGLFRWKLDAFVHQAHSVDLVRWGSGLVHVRCVREQKAGKTLKV